MVHLALVHVLPPNLTHVNRNVMKDMHGFHGVPPTLATCWGAKHARPMHAYFQRWFTNLETVCLLVDVFTSTYVPQQLPVIALSQRLH